MLVRLGASGAEFETDCPLAMFDAVQMILPARTGLPTALDAKVMTVTGGGTGRRTVTARFGDLDWDVRTRLEALSSMGDPGA